MAQKETELAKLEELMGEGSFWENQEEAQKVISQSNDLKAWTIPYKNLKERFESAEGVLPEAAEMGDDEFIAELLGELDHVEKELESLEIRRMLGGELDNKNCYLQINSGAGGTEACDWVAMLSRMYQRWASRQGWKSEVVDALDGEVAGIKSITMKIEGQFAYGHAKAEKGVHRLVRISPFDSNARRHTSFASVDVSPEITDDIEIELRPEDIRVDTYRASGAGGQHVNKTDSAVRITHAPSGIVVTCQSQRSQVQNRETCMRLLRSQLYEKEVLEREEKIRSLSGDKKKIEWGSQIRNYVFQPYTLVKDTRTKYETGAIQSVMDGEIDEFINAYLKEFG